MIWPARRYTPPPTTSRGLLLKPWRDVYEISGLTLTKSGSGRFHTLERGIQPLELLCPKRSFLNSINQSHRMLLLQMRTELSRSFKLVTEVSRLRAFGGCLSGCTLSNRSQLEQGRPGLSSRFKSTGSITIVTYTHEISRINYKRYFKSSKEV